MTQPHAGASTHVTAGMLLPVVVLMLIWGSNWPVLKIGVAEIAPLTFRAFTLPFAGMGMLLVAHLSGDSIRIPRALWGKFIVLTIFNITFWNGLVIFGVQHVPAGRSAILAYTMPVWGVLISLVLLREPLTPRKILGLVFGMTAMALLLGESIAHLERAPVGLLLLLGASFTWAIGTVLLRKWQIPLPPNTLVGWMILLGCMPLVLAAPFFATGPWEWPSGPTLFAILYNIFLAGTVAHWAWFRLARTLPVVVSSISALSVPIVGVFAGMLVLGEQPGITEFVALGLVVSAIAAVLWPPKTAPDD